MVVLELTPIKHPEVSVYIDLLDADTSLALRLAEVVGPDSMSLLPLMRSSSMALADERMADFVVMVHLVPSFGEFEPGLLVENLKLLKEGLESPSLLRVCG